MAKQVLTVGDPATVRSVLRMTLEKEGYEILEAENGRQDQEVRAHLINQVAGTERSNYV